MTTQKFNPSEHLIQIKNRQGSSDYLPVQWRLVWFRMENPLGTITTELVHLDLETDTIEETFVWNNQTKKSEKIIKHAKGLAIFRATVTDGKGGIATGTKMEKAASFPDFIEKSETGAIGRALAALGYGTQFTGDEFAEQHRIVDTPVTRVQSAQPAPALEPMYEEGREEPQPGEESQGEKGEKKQPGQEPITGQQLTSIRKLLAHLGKQEPANLASATFLDGKQLLQQLTAEYRQAKKAS